MMLELGQGERIERVLSGETGLSRQDLTAYRREKLVKGEDWRYDKEVILTEQGYGKVRRDLLGEDLVEPAGDQRVRDGQVTKWDFRNSRMVEVDGKYLVRVRNAALWRPDSKGNRMSISYVVSGDRMYHVGKSPRYPGKW